jgi:hypothetical protein
MLLGQALELAHLRVEVAQLQATVDELARRLGRTSRNSSPLPAAGPPPARSLRARHEPRGRRPDGQPCHAGQVRALVPVAVVAVVMALRPARCAHCQPLLRGEDPAPERHQVAEIPSLRPVITEYQAQRLVCPGGGHAIPAGWFRPTKAGDHGAVLGGVSPVQTHHPARPGGLVRRLDEVGDGGQSGAGDGPGGSRTGGRGAGLCPGPAPRVSG